IDERLGLLLIGDRTNVNAIQERDSFRQIEELLLAQSEFCWLAENTAGGIKDRIEEDNKQENIRDRRWKLAFGSIYRPWPGHTDEELAQQDIGLTFCDLANRFSDCGLPKHRTQRYAWMRREFGKIRKTLPGKSPYNQFLAGKTSPSLIKIDYYTASQLVHIINQLLLSGKLKIPKEST
ncbi:MAG: hypothetical protein ACKVGW_05385, partial [Verrucomicrobiia bacterium]